MTRIRFEDLPSTNTPRNAENLNKLNNVVISSTEPTTGEEVWIDNINKKFYTKNDNGVYEEFDNSIVASGSNENGSYVKYEDGTMIQHGGGTFGSSGTNTDSYALTTFPQAFINGNWSIQYTPLYTSEFSQNFTLATILTGSHIYGETSNGNKADYVYRRLSYLSPDAVGQADLYASAIPYSWVAIGYWK